MQRQHQEREPQDCRSGERLLPSQMTVEQFDEMLSHMSRREIRQAFKRMANDSPAGDRLHPCQLDEGKQGRSDAKHCPGSKRRPAEDPNQPLPPVELPPPPPPPGRPGRRPPAPPTDRTPPPPPPPEPRFYGINAGIIKLGVTDDGSLNAGVNIGIARVDTKFGLQNSVDARAGIGDFNAHTGAGVGIGREGVRSHVYAGAKVFEAAHVDAGFGAGVGPRTGVDGRLSANVGPARFKLNTDHEVGVRGLYSGVDARVGVPPYADFQTKAHVAVNRNSSAGADVVLHSGRSSLGTGVGIDTEGNRLLRPHVHIDARNGINYHRSAIGAQLGPGLDVRVGAGQIDSYHNGYRRHYARHIISTGVGVNGIGVRETSKVDATRYRDWAAGVGRDYE